MTEDVIEDCYSKNRGKEAERHETVQASIAQYGYGTVYAESKDEAEEKAKHLQSDEIKGIKSNGSENILVYCCGVSADR